MISAKERDTLFIKLSGNESLNDLQNAIEVHEITSGTLRGFGNLKVMEGENKIVDGGDGIIEGVISEMDGKPLLDIYCYANNFAGKVKNFVVNDFTVTVTCFYEVALISRANEKGEVQMTIAPEKIRFSGISEKKEEGPAEQTKTPEASPRQDAPPN
ncbi:MAG: hypothetical protein JW727_06130 [Candidatus Aenigmarchaeota archaeon]|nr:hypothetical protein [Candidatus Aenigmarchaeota archaeon]